MCLLNRCYETLGLPTELHRPPDSRSDRQVVGEDTDPTGPNLPRLPTFYIDNANRHRTPNPCTPNTTIPYLLLLQLLNFPTNVGSLGTVTYYCYGLWATAGLLHHAQNHYGTLGSACNSVLRCSMPATAIMAQDSRFLCPHSHLKGWSQRFQERWQEQGATNNLNL